MADQASGSGAETGIPVFVMLPLHILDGKTNAVEYARTPSTDLGSGQLYDKLKTDKEKWLLADLVRLRKANVQGVMVDCWWGKVEAEGPGQYNWDGYKNLFSIVKDANLELHVVMSFHACVENGVETIPLPGWVKSIGEDKDLFYKDAHGNPSTEYLSGAVDNKRVFKDDQSGNQLSPLQVYQNFMIGFDTHMDDYFKKGIITMIEVGLGPCGELRYPAYRRNWIPTQGIGEFQCYDEYMMGEWKKEAKSQNLQLPQGVGPQTAGEYNSKPDQTLFFQDQPEQPETSLIYGPRYWDNYGKSFLTWYSGYLVAHGKGVLLKAKDVFKSRNVKIAAKVPGIHWWYGTLSHAAEATAGFFEGDPKKNLSVYKSIADMLESLEATFIFTCAEMKDDPNNATGKPGTLVTEVLGEAQPKEASIACENASPIATKNSSEEQESPSYNQIIVVARDYDISYFTYLRLGPELMDENRFRRFEAFVQGMKARTLIEPPQEASPSAA